MFFILVAAVCAAETVTDSFDTNHDYLTAGTAGTIWDGFLVNGGLGPLQDCTPVAADANQSSTGRLVLRSSNGNWEGDGDDGMLLYKTVTGDFTAEVEVTACELVHYNDLGLMARDPRGTGINYVALRYFMGLFNAIRTTTNGTTGNIDSAGAKTVLRLSRVGNDFHFARKDPGGAAFEPMTGSSLSRPDLPATLQVGIWQATFSQANATGEFDDFSLTTAATSLSPILWNIGGDGNHPATVAGFVNAGVEEDLTEATVFNVVGDTTGLVATDNRDISLTYLTGGAGNSNGLGSGFANDLLNQYHYYWSNTQGPSTLEISGLSGVLNPSSVYKLYVFGTGDAANQNSIFTFDGTSVTTDGSAPPANPDQRVAVFTFNTGATVSDTLEFEWARVEANRFAGFNGFAIAQTSGERYDMGDLPASYAVSLLEDNGARHRLPVGGGIRLGTAVDSEPDGQASADAGRSGADGDDGDGTDDDDGVSVVGTWSEGADGGALGITVSGGNGYVSAWIDWGDDGNFTEAGDHVVNMRPVGTGYQGVTFDVPAGTMPMAGSYERFARCRLTSTATPVLGVTGTAADGEVEDYLLEFLRNEGSPNVQPTAPHFIGVTNTNRSITLHCTTGGTNGIYLLESSATMTGLMQNADVAAIGVIDGNSNLAVDVQVPTDQTTAFFRLQEYIDATSDEFPPDITEITVHGPDIIVDPTTLPATLPVNTPFGIVLELMTNRDGTSEAINGLVRLAVVDVSGNVNNAFSVVPEWIPLENGTLAADIVVSGPDYTAGLYIGIVDISDGSHHPLSLSFHRGMPLRIAKSVGDYRAHVGSDWQHPFRGDNRWIPTNFALRRGLRGAKTRYCRGVVFELKDGSNLVYPAKRGVVSRIRWVGSPYSQVYGYGITLNHGNGYETEYFGLHQCYVQEHQVVERNELLGTTSPYGKSDMCFFRISAGVLADYRLTSLSSYQVNPHREVFDAPLMAAPEAPVVALVRSAPEASYSMVQVVRATQILPYAAKLVPMRPGYHYWAPYSMAIHGQALQATFDGFADAIAFDTTHAIEAFDDELGRHLYWGDAAGRHKKSDRPCYRLGLAMDEGHKGHLLAESTAGPRGYQYRADDADGDNTVRLFEFGPEWRHEGFWDIFLADPTVNPPQHLYSVEAHLGWIPEEGNVSLHDTITVSIDNIDAFPYHATFAENGRTELSWDVYGHGHTHLVPIAVAVVDAPPGPIFDFRIVYRASSRNFPSMVHEIALQGGSGAPTVSRRTPSHGLCPLTVTCDANTHAYSQLQDPTTFWSVQGPTHGPAPTENYIIHQANQTLAVIEFVKPGLYHIAVGVNFVDDGTPRILQGNVVPVHAGRRGPLFRCTPATGDLPQTGRCEVVNMDGFAGVDPANYDFDWQITGFDFDGVQIPADTWSLTTPRLDFADFSFTEPGAYTIASILEYDGERYVGEQRTVLVGIERPCIQITAPGGYEVVQDLYASVTNTNTYQQFTNAYYRWNVSGCAPLGQFIGAPYIRMTDPIGPETIINLRADGVYTTSCDLVYGDGCIRSEPAIFPVTLPDDP
jgi:regulation of enolase protein 1 (concanavalin A-like superfamily)